jgi:hypothetical protein
VQPNSGGGGGEGEEVGSPGGGDGGGLGYFYAITVVWSMIVSPVLSDIATPSSYVLQVSV